MNKKIQVSIWPSQFMGCSQTLPYVPANTCGLCFSSKKEKKGHLWVGIQQDRVGRKGWGSDAIFIAIIIWWPNPWPLTSALKGLFNWPVVMERRRTGWEVQADEEQLFAAWTHPQADPLPSLVITSSWPRNKNVNTLLLIHWLETKASREVRALLPAIHYWWNAPAKSWSQIPQC